MRTPHTNTAKKGLDNESAAKIVFPLSWPDHQLMQTTMTAFLRLCTNNQTIVRPTDCLVTFIMLTYSITLTSELGTYALCKCQLYRVFRTLVITYDAAGTTQRWVMKDAWRRYIGDRFNFWHLQNKPFSFSLPNPPNMTNTNWQKTITAQAGKWQKKWPHRPKQSKSAAQEDMRAAWKPWRSVTGSRKKDGDFLRTSRNFWPLLIEWVSFTSDENGTFTLGAEFSCKTSFSETYTWYFEQSRLRAAGQERAKL